MQLAKTILSSAPLALISLPVHARFRIAWQRMWTFDMSSSLSASGYLDGWSALQRADEALLLFEPNALVVGGALYGE